MNHILKKLVLVPLVLVTDCLSAPVRLVEEAPVSVTRMESGTVLVDFGRVAFGNIQLIPGSNADLQVTVHFGEDFRNGRINRTPPGTVRYASSQVHLKGASPVIAAPPADKRNTDVNPAKPARAILTPPEWGVILPFRWVEIEGWQGPFDKSQIVRRSAFASTWDDTAASFESSDETLNRIWELCRYSIKATTFAGIYVDGDRERIPYEADAYLNQLSHYTTDHDIQMARDTFDWLMVHPTWPTEWSFHMIFMAHADYMHTGDTKWISSRFDSLKPKLLLEKAREDGLLVSSEAQRKKLDIVDWPQKERDGYVFRPINTVVNAFHIRCLGMMSEMAAALGRDRESQEYRAMATKAHASFQRLLFDPVAGAYRDGDATDHSSQHANLFPLAFDLVPSQYTPAVVNTVQKRGMACSVYAAQYLMEGLFANDAESRALELMTAPNDRSWRHMVESGTTITWEAWDMKYKPNQDWNHAWGAAPANLLPRFVIGASPATAGWKTALISPRPGDLSFAHGKIPTPRGPITVEWKRSQGFHMKLRLPGETTARLELPASPSSKGVAINGKPVAATRDGARWLVRDEVSGEVQVEVR